MQANILWTGREYYSLENCLVTVNESGAVIDSRVVGSYQGSLYHVEYKIQTNEKWETIRFELKTQVNGKQQIHKRDLEQPVDIDIPLTPFTNTLPIRRLKLAIGETREISVLYLDILADNFRMLRQKYHRISEFEYKYENVPNDFEAVITVDEDGLVVDYPELFVRTERVNII